MSWKVFLKFVIIIIINVITIIINNIIIIIIFLPEPAAVARSSLQRAQLLSQRDSHRLSWAGVQAL